MNVVLGVALESVAAAEPSLEQDPMAQREPKGYLEEFLEQVHEVGVEHQARQDYLAFSEQKVGQALGERKVAMDP